MSKYRVFSGPYFPAFGLNMKRFRESLHIQSECAKIWTRKNSVFGHFSRSETVKTPAKCSHILWVIKVNKKLVMTSVCCSLYTLIQCIILLTTHCIINKILIRKPLLDISHIQLFWFPFDASCKKKKHKSKRSFSCKVPRPAFSFLAPVSLEIFTAGFSSRIFVFPPVHWLTKSDYSSLNIIRILKLVEAKY